MSRPRGATIPPVPDNDSLQARYAPATRCFGCGPANEKGLRIKSRVVDGELVAQWTPEPHHEAYAGMLNGGIIGTLLDCHGNWAAAYYLMTRDRLDTPPRTLTPEVPVQLRRAAPAARPLTLPARAGEA